MRSGTSQTAKTPSGWSSGEAWTSTPTKGDNRFWTDFETHGALGSNTQPVGHPTDTTGVREPRTLYFDLEIRRTLDEMGGSWDNVRKGGGVSILCIWDDQASRPYFYDDHTLLEAVRHLESGELVVSFNGSWFDVPLLTQHLDRNVQLREHLDLFRLIKVALDREGKSWKGHGLDAVCNRTIGRGKIGHGEHAPLLARAGRWGELVNYCLEDVLLTRDLALHIRKNGFILDIDGEKLALEPPDWFRDPS